MDPSLNGEEQIEELPAEEAPAPEAPEEFKFKTLPPEISFATRDVLPPAECYIGPNDWLVLHVWNAVPNAVVGLTLRILKPDGQLINTVQEFRPTSDRLVNSWCFPLCEGFLLGAILGAWGGVRGAGCYAACSVAHGRWGSGGTAHMLLVGYLVHEAHLTWPYPRYVGPCEGPGRLRVIVGTDPAAGFPFFEVVPAGARWRLLAVRAQLLTSVVAGNRYVLLTLDDGAQLWWQSVSMTAQPPNWWYTYTWAVGADARVGVPQGWVQDRLPDHLTLAAGWRFYSNTIGGDPGDDWGAPVYYVEEWVEP